MPISSSDTDKIAQRLGEVRSVLLLASERSKDSSPEAKTHFPRFAHFCNMLNFKMNIQQFSRIKHLLNI
jgi:hypothetical protein